MKMKMNHLIITEYCSTDKRKYRFVKDMSEDPLVRHFVSNSMEEWLEDSEGLQEVLVGPAYIIEDERKLIGFIRLAFLDSDGTLNLHYAVHPNYRKQHYGTKILQETSQYIFKNFSNIKKIELYIKEINTGSIKCAEHANFIYEKDFPSRKDDCKIRIYQKIRN